MIRFTKISKCRLAWLLYFLMCSASSVLGREEPDAEVQERVASLIQDVLGSYPPGSRWTNGAISSSITSTNVEINFREASRLMPHRLDLRFGIASSLIGQALSTNAPFADRMKSALEVYEEIYRLDSNSFLAPLLQQAYSQAMKETNFLETSLLRLRKRDADRSSVYLSKFKRVEELWNHPPHQILPTSLPNTAQHFIVILGAGLETNGTMKPKLIDRLQQGRALANQYPESRIIVTGGNQRAGLTEAYMMSRWLSNEGISTNRVYLEDQARDTVGNALRTSVMLKGLGASHVTLVTSASHMRRALAIFEEAAFQQQLPLQFADLASKDTTDIDELRDRVSIYRDVLRASGVWTYPGIQR
jgi:uncharacterized SAM-binding protein YcdF (DUF218 family)